ncbi:MAG: protein O-mannosyl-transferase family, partial [Anaerolineales bacterium]
MQLNVRRLSASFWAGAAVVVLTGFLYLATLQHDINGADGPYTPDVGEIVNALNLWGTLHQAGYPVFSVMGSAFVTLVRLAGIPPAMAASLWSWVWGLATVGLTYGIALRLTGRWPIASGAAMLYAVSRSLWVNASIAELHTFSMALAALAMLLAFRIADGDHDGDFRWLAFVLGLAVSHQRALILLAPSL